MAKIIMKRIVASLEFGVLYTGTMLALFYCVSIACIGLACVLLVLSINGYSELVIGVVLFYLLGICLLIFIILNHTRYVRVKKYLKDAVEIKAQTSSLGDSIVYSGMIPLKTKKIW